MWEAATDNLDQPYEWGINDCDIWIETVLRQAGVNPLSYLAGPASGNEVRQHINATLADGRTVAVARNATNIPIAEGNVYVVFMDNVDDERNPIPDTFRPHAVLLFANEGGGVYIFHTSIRPGYSVRLRYDSANLFQRDFVYSRFYYQQIQ